jgi:histidinol-phosphate phosphatase family protein
MAKKKASNSKSKAKAVFLDRDGVINKRRRTYVKSWSEFKFLPGVKEAIKVLIENGYEIIVVSNQGAVGWGVTSKSALAEIHRNMNKELKEAGAELTEVFFCPHNPVLKCECRKPRPGMLVEAGKKYNIDPERSWMIGDMITDIQAGKAYGSRTIQIKAGNKADTKKSETVDNTEPDYIVKNLTEAVEIIIKESG